MKTYRHLLTLSLLVCGLWTSCQQTGTVNTEMLRETLSCRKMAVTPHQPAWLSEQKDIHPLSAADLQKVQTILRSGSTRHVADRYYRNEEEGNRGDSSSNLFYLYGDNAQCLGGRVINGQVYMDDLKLNEPQRRELYRILTPYLQKLPKELD